MEKFLRLRRTRSTPWLRNILTENTLAPSDLILPIFVTEGHNIKDPIITMPDVNRLSIDQVELLAFKAQELGIKAIALFPHITNDLKSEDACEAFNLDNLICRCIRRLKKLGLKIGIICDVALDPYTSHGQDGIIVEGSVHNDQTLAALNNQALVLAKAGADIIAPSDMMDGRISTIRTTLDNNGFEYIPIIAYSAKYASSFYGPFRDAVGSKQVGGVDKKTYQLNPANSKEALREMEADIVEEADILLIKPGIFYLDIVYQAVQNSNLPVFAYQVSGEYSMLKFAASAGAFNWEQTILESLICFKRAGAKAIFTYAAIEVAEFLNNRERNYE